LHGIPEWFKIDVDATLLTAHSEKKLAAGNYKHRYGFHPRGARSDEAGRRLRFCGGRDAGANTAADHVTVIGRSRRSRSSRSTRSKS
jgi:hypothetical protein